MNNIQPQNKILIITYYWPPAGGPGVQRWVKFTKYLSQLGYELYILTVDEKLASYALSDNTLATEIPSSVKVFRTKTREFYSTYLRISKKENIPFSGFVNESETGVSQKIIRFFRSHLFIPDPRRGWNRFAYPQACQLLEKENISILITTSPPHSTQLIGKQLKREFPSIKWIADFRDPWTDVFYFDKLCHSPLSKGINKSMEKSVLQHADKVIVVSKSMKSDFENSHGSSFNPEKIHILANGFDEEDFIQVRPLQDKEFTITYTGTLASNYNINAFLDAVKELRTTHDKIRLRFIGEICPEYKSILSSDAFKPITELVPRVPHEEAIRHLLRSHMLLLVIPQAPKNESIITGKLLEYLAAKNPILGIGPVHGDASKLLQETEAGKMFDYNNAESIKSYLLEMTNAYLNSEILWMGHDTEKYSRSNLTKQLIRLF
jgi:glycosyltransferase involved in cell wall biosynthesis